MTRRPVWFATPSLQGTRTLDFLPAYPGASGHHTFPRSQVVLGLPRQKPPPLPRSDEMGCGGWPRQLVVWVPQAQEVSRYAFPYKAASLSSRSQREISCDPGPWLVDSPRRSHRQHEISRYARNDRAGVGETSGGVIHAEHGNEVELGNTPKVPL